MVLRDAACVAPRGGVSVTVGRQGSGGLIVHRRGSEGREGRAVVDASKWC